MPHAKVVFTRAIFSAQQPQRTGREIDDVAGLIAGLENRAVEVRAAGQITNGQAGVTWKQLRIWKAAGLIAPDEIEAGVADWWSIQTGFTAALLAGLRRAGQPIEVLKAGAEMCREPVEAKAEPVKVKV